MLRDFPLLELFPRRVLGKNIWNTIENGLASLDYIYVISHNCNEELEYFYFPSFV